MIFHRKLKEKKAAVIEYLKSLWWVKLNSQLLNETILLASGKDVKTPKGIVIYLPDEINLLDKMSREEVKTLHLIKKMFGGYYQGGYKDQSIRISTKN